MLVLAVDSSSDRLKIGVANEERVFADFTGPDDRHHAERIITALDSLLRRTDIQPATLDCLAVATGPGSFTGLRVGIAMVLGLAQAWQKEILAAGNLMLEKLFSAESGTNPTIVIHSRGDEFYLSEDGDKAILLKASEIAARYGASTFAGPGAPRLARLATTIGFDFNFAAPESYSGGELARLFARNHNRFGKLDPVNLDVNYLLKSQPEERRDAGRREYQTSEMSLGDLDDVIRIERDAFSDPWDRESFRSDVGNPHVITLAARHQSHCIGYLSCIALDDYGYVANIAVDRSFRSQGVGRALMDELKRKLSAKGIGQIVLDVRTSNQEAVRFYEKYGFAIIARRKGFYSNPPEDSFTMQLNMGNC